MLAKNFAQEEEGLLLEVAKTEKIVAEPSIQMADCFGMLASNATGHRRTVDATRNIACNGGCLSIKHYFFAELFL